MRDFALIDRRFGDLNPLIIGEEACAPGHTFGPAVREYTLIHFVTAGNGLFWREGVAYPVHAGEAFIIRSGEVTTYSADQNDPWSYQWVGFTGALTAKFTDFPAVVPYHRNWVEEMLSSYENDGMGEWRVASLLFSMCAEFFAVLKPKNHYVRRVQTYIDSLYMQPIRVEAIAEQLSLDRRYLSRLFKAKMGCTVQEYLIRVRMEAAKRQLLAGASVAEAAQRCGYDDVCNFSKMFKRMTGKSPGQIKKEGVQSR